jgi:hypothetical protein
MALQFPSDWPNDCPPSDAVDAAGEVFRIVRHEPPNDADFASHDETGKLPKAPACLRCGLSVFREIRDAIHQRQLIPKLGSLIAQATLQAEHGKTKPTKGTQPTHTTWWAYEGLNRASLFSVFREEG